MPFSRATEGPLLSLRFFINNVFVNSSLDVSASKKYFRQDLAEIMVNSSTKTEDFFLEQMSKKKNRNCFPYLADDSICTNCYPV